MRRPSGFSHVNRVENGIRPLLRSAAAFVLLALAVSAPADVVELDNGDRISGTVQKKSDGRLVIDSRYAGRLTINWSHVVRLITETPLLFRLQDGTELRGLLDEDKQGNTLIKTGTDSARALPALASIARISAIPAPGPPAYRWRGTVNLAGERNSGNTDTASIALDARTVVEQKGRRRFTLGAGLSKEHSDGSLTKEQYLLNGKFDRFFDGGWFAFLGADLEKDEFKDLNLRAVYSAGSGYQFFDSDELRLSLELGLSYTNEDFITDEDNAFSGFNWSLNWEQALFADHLKFFHRHSGNQGLDTTDNLLIKVQTGVRIPVINGIHASAEHDIEWDRSPADDAESVDNTYKFGLGYEW